MSPRRFTVFVLSSSSIYICSELYRISNLIPVTHRMRARWWWYALETMLQQLLFIWGVNVLQAIEGRFSRRLHALFFLGSMFIKEERLHETFQVDFIGSTGVRFTKEFGGQTSPKIGWFVTKFGAGLTPKLFSETHPRPPVSPQKKPHMLFSVLLPILSRFWTKWKKMYQYTTNPH